MRLLLLVLLVLSACLGSQPSESISPQETVTHAPTETPLGLLGRETAIPSPSPPGPPSKTAAPPATISPPLLPEPVEFEDLTWVNSRPYTLEELKGKVVLIEFWNRFCTRCQRLHPRMLEYHNKYSGQGLVILALHVPAIPEDKDPVFFKGIVNEMNIKHPVALDSNYQNWFNYGVEYTGTIFLIDKKGKVRYFIGIGTYDTLEDRIIELLAE